MRKMMQRSLSCLLTLAMVVTMLMTSTLAAEKSAKLEFDYSANYESSKVVSLEVYKGYPADSYAKEEEIFSQLEAITPQADGSYVVTAPGTCSPRIRFVLRRNSMASRFSRPPYLLGCHSPSL